MIAFLKAMIGLGGEQIGVHEAVRRINRGAIVVDVRENREFIAIHVAQAKHLPLRRINGNHAELCAALALHKPPAEILLVCASGMRSRVAQNRLAGSAGCRYVNVAGGMQAWLAAGLPTSSGRN